MFSVRYHTENPLALFAQTLPDILSFLASNQVSCFSVCHLTDQEAHPTIDERFRA